MTGPSSPATPASAHAIDRCQTTCYRPPRLRILRCVSTVAVLAVAPLLGCGPVEYISQVGNRAASAVSSAKLAQADRYAPFEYTAAEEYLHKAREEAGYAEYQDAIEFGRKAEDFANRARAIAVSKQAAAASKSSRVTPSSEREEPSGAKRSEPE